jgi:Protein of unknown function (DUF998)
MLARSAVDWTRESVPPLAACRLGKSLSREAHLSPVPRTSPATARALQLLRVFVGGNVPCGREAIGMADAPACDRRDAFMTRRLLLVCGVLSSIVYIGVDVLAEVFHGGYHSFTSQAVSELMATGAPTERLVDPIYLLLYGPLLIAFGVGVWMSPGPKRLMHVTGGLVIASALLGFSGPTLFEMDVRGSAGDPRADVLHIAVTAALSLIILLFIGFGAFVRGRGFRSYSFATIAVMLVFGALTGLASRPMTLGQPTPWLGVVERIVLGAYLLWVAVLAILLGRAPHSTATTPTRSGKRVPLAAGAAATQEVLG